MSTGYAEILGAVSPTARTGGRAAEIVAALAPPPPPGEASTAMVKAEPKADVKKVALALVPGVIGAGVGALVWKDHRLLGALAGHAVASTAVPIWRGGAERKRGLCQLGIEGAGVVGALLWEKHPVVGWLGGVTAGALVTAFVPGSPAQKAYKDLKTKWGM